MKGAGEEHRVKVYIVTSRLGSSACRHGDRCGDCPVSILPKAKFVYAVVLGIYSNILLGLGPLRKQFLATYIKDLFLGKMLRSNKSRK